MISRRVQIDSALPPIVPGAVSFETGATRAQAADPEKFVYEHHGDQFGWADPGALTVFYEDLIHGREMPPVFATAALRDIDTIVAIALFKRPDLVFVPATLHLVMAADLVHRRGAVGLAHIDGNLGRFFNFLRFQFFGSFNKKELNGRLDHCYDHIVEYITENRLPHLGSPPEPPKVIDTGNPGFVVSETKGSLLDGWVQLFRMGYVKGIVVSPEIKGRRAVLVGRKGPYVAFGLEMAARLFNDMERAMGELAEWRTDGMWLYGPSEGTSILVSHMLEVLVRV